MVVHLDCAKRADLPTSRGTATIKKTINQSIDPYAACPDHPILNPNQSQRVKGSFSHEEVFPSGFEVLLRFNGSLINTGMVMRLCVYRYVLVHKILALNKPVEL